MLRLLARSQLEFVADLFWIRMGSMAGLASTPTESLALVPIAHLIADLAPAFKYPYFVGGIMAPVRRGLTNEYDNAPESIALLGRGIKAVPTYGRLYLTKSYNELVMTKDPAAAAATLQLMAAQPDAPSYIALLVSRLLTEGRKFDGAREFARSMALSEDPQVKAEAEARLRLIDLEQVLGMVDEAVAKFQAAEGRLPVAVEELVQRGFLAELPVDPYGGRIEITERGSRSSMTSDRLRVFIPREE